MPPLFTSLINPRNTRLFHTTTLKMTYQLIALGNPLLDIQFNVDKAYLDKYDLKENDAILVEEKHMPIFGEGLANPNVKLVAGGAAQNSARGAQYILPPKSVLYFGAVGKDVYADKLTEANNKYGLDTAYQVLDDVPTGKCAALINGNNRSLATDLSACNHFKPAHLQKPENWASIEKASYFYIGGFHLTVSPEAIELLGKHAAKENKTFVVNFSAPFIPEFFKAPLDNTLKYTDIVIANESEAAAYAKSHGLENTTDVVEIAKAIAALPKVNTKKDRTVIFTQGTEETVAVTYVQATKEYKVQKFPVHVLDSKLIEDTNGAGDAFAGGFIAGLVQGKDLAGSIDQGQWLAKLSIQEVGPSFPFPKQTYTN
ncbi:unnamed protein product [Ambrosiozyma monospora]|uniref:Adenosine kinase n=1 Tax=Ambrosiozyma monospora TaxID=43982 RepID=A0A9W7DKN9_AMBMO|nr:unnamed protein product [Ambrosiozyma monospora]